MREHKEKKSDGLSYPTYGRGIDPNPNIDTYMINEHLCHDGVGTQTTKKKTLPGENGASPTKKPKQKRPKIISPSRQKYETLFERYFISKHLDKQLLNEKKTLAEEGLLPTEEAEKLDINKSME